MNSNKAFKDLVAGFRLYPVWIHQAYYHLSAKYKRTALGSLWIAANYIFVSFGITLVYGDLFHRHVQEFLPYIMMGLLAFSLCLWPLSEAPELFIKSRSIIRNHAYPFTYFVFEDVTRVLMLFCHNLVVFYILMAITGNLVVPSPSILLGLPMDIGIVMTWGCVVGMAAARYRDLRFLLSHLATILYFLTPIYWQYDMLSADHRWIADYNPLYVMLTLIRAPMLGHEPSPLNWGIAAGMLVSGIAVWFVVFGLYRRRVPFWV